LVLLWDIHLSCYCFLEERLKSETDEADVDFFCTNR